MKLSRQPLQRLAASVPAALFGAWWLRHATARAVRAFRPGAGSRRTLGSLSVRTFGGADGSADGDGDAGIVLLHGLVSSGDQYGAAYDELGNAATVLCPDLLGFGGSFDDQRNDFSLDAHLAALNEAIDLAGLGQAPLTIAGHSLGGVLALHLAASRASQVPGQVQRVVLWNAPIHPSVAATREHIRRLGLFERLVALESPLASTVCGWMCRHRTLSRWLAIAGRPNVPLAVSRGAVRHTWRSYLGGMNGIVLNQHWQDALETLSRADVPVLLVSAANDNVVDAAYYRTLAAHHTNIATVEHPTADHLLPVSYPQWCAAQLNT